MSIQRRRRRIDLDQGRRPAICDEEGPWRTLAMAQTPSITAAPPAVGRLALFAYGFRPFFLLAAFYAAFAIPVWLILMIDAGALPTALAPMQWHAHEMIFGFVLAGIMGFYLTAVPNWTGAPPLRGAALGILVALWLAARAAMWLSGVLPAGA